MILLTAKKRIGLLGVVGGLILYDVLAHLSNLLTVDPFPELLVYGTVPYEVFWTVYWSIVGVMVFALLLDDIQST